MLDSPNGEGGEMGSYIHIHTLTQTLTHFPSRNEEMEAHVNLA